MSRNAKFPTRLLGCVYQLVALLHRIKILLCAALRLNGFPGALVHLKVMVPEHSTRETEFSSASPE
jgi:hypothetical protein